MTASDHTALGQALGYVYQFERATFRLLESANNVVSVAVEHNSKQTVYVITEATAEAIAVPPCESFPRNQDGLATPQTRPGEVFKTSNGIDATMNPDGSVTTSGGSFLHRGVQWLRGGWKDEKWHQDLKKLGDPGWDEIFNRSRPTPPKGGEKNEEDGDSCPLGNK